VTAICLLLIPAVMSAQKSADAGVHGKLTLAQAIDLARSNYPAIRASQEQQKAAAGAIGIAKTAYLPRADVLWQTNRATANNVYGLLLPQGVVPSISGPVIAPNISHTAWSSAGGALLNWQPFDFGARGAKVHAARQGNEAAKQASALTMLQVTAGAGSAFFDLAAAQQLVVVAQANVKRLEAFD
jgi:outer membrane protein TolC